MKISGEGVFFSCASLNLYHKSSTMKSQNSIPAIKMSNLGKEMISVVVDNNEDTVKLNTMSFYHCCPN